MIKLWVSDLDGTLLDHRKQVSQRESEALTWAKSQGVQLVLASGRMLCEMTQVMSAIGHPTIFISQNGALTHLANEQLLTSHYFEPRLVSQVYARTASASIVRLICSGDVNYISHLTSASDLIQQRMFQPFQVLEDAECAITHSQPVCKLSYFGDMNELLLIQDQLDTQFPQQLTQFVSDIDCLDIMPYGVSKGSALRHLLNHLHIEPHEVACIGDSFNDISMFDVTPHSFAMHHAHPDVKKTATYVVDSVADAIYQLGSRDGLMK